MNSTEDSNNSDLDQDVYDSQMSAESNSELPSEEDQEGEGADVPTGNNADGIAMEENEEDLIDFVGQVLPLDEEEDTQDAEAVAGEDDDNQEPIDLEEKSVIVSMPVVDGKSSNVQLAASVSTTFQKIFFRSNRDRFV